MATETLTQTESHAPETASILAAPFKKKLNGDEWSTLAQNCWITIQASWTARKSLEVNLEKYNAILEMFVEPKSKPWVECSNIVPPLAVSKFHTLLSQIVNMVFVPEFYIVSGLPGDSEGQQDSYQVQRNYNYELRCGRPGMPTWYEEHVKLLASGLLDGTSIMEIMWKYKKRKAVFGINEPEEDDGGLPVFDEDGQPKMKRNRTVREVVDYDDVIMRTVRLKDFGLIPAEAPSINEAVGCWRNLWLYENDLRAMIEDDILDKEWVDKALDYVPSGTSDVASDRQGVYDKDAGGQINIGQAQGGMSVDGFWKNRGPLKVVRLHSSQFDMDGDGWPEENVFFIHEQSNYLLGWCPDEYIAPTRPFKSFCPNPRFGQFVGWSLIEWLAPLQTEAATIRNQRNDAVDLAISAPTAVDASMEAQDKEYVWQPGARWNINGDPNKYAHQITVQYPPSQAYQEEQFINTYADQVSGLSAPIEGAGTSSRRTAAEIKQRSSGTNVRASLMAMYFRFTARDIIQFVHSLKLQFPGSTTQSGIDPQILQKKYNIDVAGTNDPLNIDENVQEALEMYNLLHQDPDIMQDPVKRYELKKYLFQATHTKDFEGVLGTKEEAMQAKQQQAQQAQAMQQAQLQAAASGHPPQQGQQPGQPQPQRH